MSGIDNVTPAFIGVGDDLRVTAAGGGIEISVGSDAVGGIEILSGCVIDGAVGMSGRPAGIHSGDEHRLTQITDVRHLGLFKGDGLVNDVGQFGSAGN